MKKDTQSFGWFAFVSCFFCKASAQRIHADWTGTATATAS